MIGLNHPTTVICRRRMSRTAVALAALSLAAAVSTGSQAAEASLKTSATGAQSVPGRALATGLHGKGAALHGASGH